MAADEIKHFLEEGQNAQKRWKHMEAIPFYTRAIELDPQCVQAHRERAVSFKWTRHYPEAIADYNWLLERDSGDMDALFERAGVYCWARRYEEGIVDFNRLVDREPHNPKYISERGKHNMFCGHYEEALADFRRALELEPEDGWHLVNIGDAYERWGRLEEAITAFEQAAKIDKRYHCAYEMAQLYTKLGRKSQAMREVIVEYTKYNDWERKENYPSYDYAKFIRVACDDDTESSVAHITELAASGFYLDICGVTSEDYDPLPYTVVRPTLIVSERSVLFLERAHESRTNRRLIRKYGERLDLRFDTDFDEAIAACIEAHGSDIITPAFVRCFRAMRERTAGQPLRPQETPRAVSCSLYLDGRFAAGDIALISGDVYTSYTGCHTEKDSGSIHLVLISRMLIAAGFSIWDFGPCHMRYKARLGAVERTHEEFLNIIALRGQDIPTTRIGFPDEQTETADAKKPRA
jgi:Leu/Phe-tRNA-protein transferase/Tfp pilus assembly protein PilF